MHGGKLITGRRNLTKNVKTTLQYYGHYDDILNSKEFVGSASGTIHEIEESKGDPSNLDDTFGVARSLGPWNSNPLNSQQNHNSNQTINTQVSNEYDLPPKGISSI